MSDLRETLATRLLRAYGEGYEQVTRPDPDNEGGTVTNVVEAWNFVADECIRQMEWAASRQTAATDSNGSRFYTPEGWGTPWDRSKLTPAPDDWKPEGPAK